MRFVVLVEPVRDSLTRCSDGVGTLSQNQAYVGIGSVVHYLTFA